MQTPYNSLAEELEKYAFSFPILDKLSNYLQTNGKLKNKKIGWHCHLTGLTAASAKVLVNAGAEIYISECTASTTDWAAVTYMKQLGVNVFQGADSANKVLSAHPQIISDTGFVLNEAYIKAYSSSNPLLFAACEITTSGIHRLKSHQKLTHPVININDGELKTLIENYHGVGDGVLEAMFRLTWRLWTGRAVAVVGYGRVGAGVAHYLKRSGANVFVVESNPIRKLVAHYDGYALSDLKTSMSNCELVVTATGAKHVISQEEIEIAKDGILLMNVGHWAEEIDLDILSKLSVARRNVSKHLDEFSIKNNFSNCESYSQELKKVYVIASGGPANVVMLSGSPEPTLIHLTTELLCMNYLCNLLELGQSLEAREYAVPCDVEKISSILALQSLGLNC